MLEVGRIEVNAALIRYLALAAKMQGPSRPKLAEFFLADDPDRRAHERFIELHREMQSAMALVARNERERNYSVNHQTMIERLNADLAGELQAIIQYTTYAARVTGPFRPQLSDFFLAEIPDEQGHARFLANKIVALGGQPTTRPREVPEAESNRDMLKAVLEAERKAVSDYSERARQAEELGDKGLAVQLEDMVRDETAHAEETQRILEDWPM
jgi:bacterioferritin